MTDVFREERVVRVLTGRDKGLRVTVVAASVVFALVSGIVLLPGLPVFYLVLVVAVGWGARAFLKRQNREYEYTFTNGELDIDVIYNKEWRKQLYSIDLQKDVLLMAPVSAAEHRAEWEGTGVPISVGRTASGEGAYVLLVRKDGRRTVLTWDPSEEMVQACRRVAPRIVHV